jgi:hypothetical protein
VSLLYTQKPCGCLVLLMDNDPAVIRWCAKDIAREARKGRALHEATADSVPPHTCAEHKGKRHLETSPATRHRQQPAPGSAVRTD